MKISSKGEYGLRALLDLAQHYGKDPVTSADIAARQQIPEAYLNHLLTTLHRAGLVRSIRGPKGGHVLARSPASITLAEAVIALEGGFSPVQAINGAPPNDEPLEVAILNDVWRQVETAIEQVLASVTLEDLCQLKLAREQRIMYYI